MTQAEIPQPIGATPTRWGGFTTVQLSWIGLGAALPYLLLRLHLSPLPALVISTPWLALALIFAFGRRDGRRMDAWVGDWVVFKFQPHLLRHPGVPTASRSPSGYVDVDRGSTPPELGSPPESAALPWVAP